MELNIIKKEERPLLQAEDVLSELSYEGTTPSRKELAQEIAKKTKSNLEQVVVRKIQGVFGHRKASVQATIYQNKEILEKVENKPILKRHKSKEELKAEAEAANPVKEGE